MPALLLPLQGEKVGMRGSIHELRTRGETPQPSPPEGGEEARAPCPPHLFFSFAKLYIPADHAPLDGLRDAWPAAVP
jgi:hypothetical protein